MLIKLIYIFNEDLKVYPCLCLCFGLEQTTIIRLLLRISRQLSHILRTEARTFIFYTPFF